MVVKLHGGLGDQLSMYYAATKLAKTSGRELVLSRWTVDKTHAGSPYGLFDLVPENIKIEEVEDFFESLQMKFHRKLSGWLREILQEQDYFRIKLFLDRLVSLINNTTSFDFDIGDSFYISREISKLSRRKRVKLDCYFPISTDQKLGEIQLDLPGLFDFNNFSIFGDYAILHFRVGDIIDTYSTRGVLSENYYLECVERIRNIFPLISIYAVSDNVERAKNLFKNLRVNWIDSSDNFNSLETLRILANSKILITANSSLSIWAGILNPNIDMVLTPMYPNKSDFLAGVVNHSYPENWVLVPNGFYGD